MIQRKQVAAFAVAVLIGETFGAAREPVVVTNGLESAYALKLGYGTFDSVAGTRSSPAFVHLTEQLKGLCAASYLGSRTPSGGRSNGWLRPLEVDIAFGSDYQILSWLRSARIDAAVLSPLSLRFYDAGMTNLICLSAPDGTDGAFVEWPKLRSLVFRTNEWVHSPDPEASYEAFLQAIAKPAGSETSNRFRLVAPSHFSAAGFIAPVVYAKKWLEKFAMASTSSTTAKIDDRFWKSFFAHLEFSLDDPQAQISATKPTEGAVRIEFSAGSSNDDGNNAAGWAAFTNVNYIVFASVTNILVARNEAVKKARADPFRNQPPVPTRYGPTVEALFADGNWQRLGDAKFTIGELLALLRHDQKSSEHNELALVLSGGGVKAAYQSALIDYLYSTNLLSNSTNPPDGTLRVKSIVGNSGGALLGFFVAGLQENDSRNLSSILWRPNGKLLTDRAIFGFSDLPRWASFVVCAWVFITVLRLSQRMKDPRGQMPPVQETKGLPWFFWGLMALMLILTPILLQLVNGEYGVEHIPEVEGWFYFVCQCLMLFIDNCVVCKDAALKTDQPRRWKLWTWELALFAMGVAIISFHVLNRNREWSRMVLGENVITLGGLGFCCGVFIYWCSLILWARKQDGYHLQGVNIYALTVLMASGIIVLTYLTMVILVRIGWHTFLELTGAFWISLILLTAVWSLIYFLISTSKKCPEWLRKYPGAAYEYQRSRHPSGKFGLTRLVRIHLIFTMGFCLWNVVVAPAIYGNKQAHEYLLKATDRFVALSGGTTNDYQLQTLYAAPANDLAGNRERYFLFYPQRNDLSNKVASLKEQLNNDVRKRWTVLTFSNRVDMQKVVFASGSPFPIFPPHLIELEKGGRKERLVDGGYAHNVPLEAARQIGARQVLVLNSSPTDDSRPTEVKTNANESVFGQLTCNISRLVPFLFEHAQVADFLSQEEMFIVSLSPNPTNDWPSLFDFRQRTVGRMLDTARRDTTNRIGRIEAHGLPSFLPLIRMAADQK